jgi:hypothetical protein
MCQIDEALSFGDGDFQTDKPLRFSCQQRHPVSHGGGGTWKELKARLKLESWSWGRRYFWPIRLHGRSPNLPMGVDWLHMDVMGSVFGDLTLVRNLQIGP